MEAHVEQLRAKIIEGLKLTSKRLIQSKAKEDGDLIFSTKGKIIRVKARTLLPQS